MAKAVDLQGKFPAAFTREVADTADRDLPRRAAWLRWSDRDRHSGLRAELKVDDRVPLTAAWVGTWER